MCVCACVWVGEINAMISGDGIVGRLSDWDRGLEIRRKSKLAFRRKGREIDGSGRVLLYL